MISLDEIKTATLEDEVLCKLKQAIINDEPNLWKSADLKPFNKLKTELFIVNDIILRTNRILAPSRLQQKLIELAHVGHQGITKTLKLLRTKIWFSKVEYSYCNCHVIIVSHSELL